MDLSYGSALQINFYGNMIDATVNSTNESTLSVVIDDETVTYIADFDNNKIYDQYGNEGIFRQKPISLSDLIQSGTNVNDIDNVVWRMVTGGVPECNCVECTLLHIRILNNAANNPPPFDNIDIPLACMYIFENMIPRMQSRVIGIFNEIVADGTIDRLAEVLEASILDGPKRTPAKPEVIESLGEFIHPYYPEKNSKCDTCTICLDTFSDIQKTTGNPVMVVDCPNCENCFCAGKQKSDTNDEDSCQGFLRLMGDDNRCPICRTDVKDWKDISSNKKLSEVKSTLTPILVEEVEENIIDNILLEPKVEKVRKRIYSPIKYIPAKKYKTQKRPRVMRHNRQYYGAKH
jgi:hypothetical protein